MGELLGENKELIVGNFQGQRLFGRSDRRFSFVSTHRQRADYFDPNRNAALLLNLVDGDRTIGAI